MYTTGDTAQVACTMSKNAFFIQRVGGDGKVLKQFIGASDSASCSSVEDPAFMMVDADGKYADIGAGQPKKNETRKISLIARLHLNKRPRPPTPQSEIQEALARLYLAGARA